MNDMIAAAGLNLSQVVAVNRYGDVMIEALTADGDDGKWMSCLNFAIPQLGDYVYWTYIKGVPMVMGVMPKLENPYGFDTPSYRTYIDHFFLNHRAETSNNIGEFGWTFAQSGGFTFVATGSVADYGPGWQRIHTSGTNGNSAVLTAPRAPLVVPSNVREIEFGFSVGQTAAVGYYLGLGSALHSFPYALMVRYNTTDSDTTWMAVKRVNSVQTEETLYVPITAGSRMTATFRNLLNGSWNISVKDYDLTGAQGEMDVTGIPDNGTYLYVGCYDRGGGTARWLDLNYVAITMFGLKRGALDISLDS